MLLVQLHAAAMTLMMLNSCLCLLLDVPAWSKIGRPLVRRQHERRLSQLHILYYLVAATGCCSGHCDMDPVKYIPMHASCNTPIVALFCAATIFDNHTCLMKL